jgi:integrase
MKLTAAAVRSLILPPGVRDKVFFDDSLPGFGLRLRDTGGRSWIVQYAIAGRTRRMPLGSTALLDLSRARAMAKDLLAQVRLGRDPVNERAQTRARAAESISALLPRFLQRQRTRLKPRSYQEVERHLLVHAKPLHSYAIDGIERRTIAVRLAAVEKSSGPAAANRVRASLSSFFAWAAREGFVDSNPVAFTNKAVENGSRERVLADDELVAIWRAAGDGQYGAIVKILMLSGARRDEIASLRWSEIDSDTETITLPAARTKNRREHVIPLSDAVRAILAAQPRRLDADGSPRDLVFGYGATGWQDWSGSKADLDARLGNAFEWTPHDFRRSLSTALHERFGVPPHVVEAILGHVGGHRGGVAGVYNRAIYLEERRRALQRWGEHIEGLVTGAKPSKVVKLRKQR